MRLLLLGCTGFIGSGLVPKLLHSGHQLSIVSRKKKNKVNPVHNNDGINYIQADLTTSLSWQQTELQTALKNAEGVINLVGEPIAEKRWSKNHCEKIIHSRLKTTELLIQTIKELKTSLKVLINGSAIGFYGTSRESIYTEESLQGKDFLADLCFEWEKIASMKPKKTRLTIIRTGIVLEKDGGALGKMLPVFRAGFGGPIGNGLQWMSWIHRSDYCKIIETALTKKDWEGIFNGVSPNPVTMSEFSKTLGKTLNRPNLLPVPGYLLKLLLGDGAKVVLEGQKVLPIRLQKKGFQFQYRNLSDALLNITTSSKTS
ncbi:TIGR01777 family oxidoreductase [Prochlorococcus marinus]|uniref:TIGR01777 family oxidoreductase n=1 Tax=Prochlorococcus marinus TaxID=1219 RepID=UPI0022B40BB0|nr:TIGR01777 family oxidoreductase [Prochlorococcus marinus]